MWKQVLIKIGFFLFELGAQVLIQVIFGKENRERFELLVRELAADSELTAKQKYNRAKKFLDEVKEDVPDTLKNMAIEAVVAKVTDKADKALKKIK